MEYSEELYEQSMRIIRAVAQKISRKEEETLIEYQDLIEVGKEAFLKALKTYKPDKGTKFSTYLHIKAKSAMKDEVRKSTLYRRAKPCNVAMVLYENKNKHQDLIEVSNPEELILVREEKSLLKEKLRDLPKQHKKIIRLLYWNGMSMMEVASHLDLSEGRVCQIHKEALDYLREEHERENNTITK